MLLERLVICIKRHEISSHHIQKSISVGLDTLNVKNSNLKENMDKYLYVIRMGGYLI